MLVKRFREEFYDIIRRQQVPYSMVPVTCMQELRHAYVDHCGEHVNAVIFINCGAGVNLVEELLPAQDVLFYVIDSRRPIHHENIYNPEDEYGNNRRVKVLVSQNDDVRPPSIDTLYTDEQSDSDASVSGEGASDDDDNDEDGTAAGERPRKRRRFDVDRLTRRMDRRERRRRWNDLREKSLLEYYQFTSYGTASAILMYDLAFKLSRDSNDLLWWTIVGLTEQLVHNKINTEKYMLDLADIQQHVLRLNHNVSSQGSSYSVDCMKISFIPNELMLTFYRRWTLYDSLEHSALTACRFKVWKATNYHCRLKTFLVELGVPLKESKQAFSCMRSEFQSKLGQMVEDKAEKFKLQDLLFGSFVAKFGFNYSYTATDIVHSMTALLEIGVPSLCSQNDATLRKDKFSFAIDSLLRWKIELIELGIQQYKVYLHSVLQYIKSIIVMKRVIGGGSYLCVNVGQGAPEFFTRPISLTTFARFLLRAYIAEYPNKRVVKLPLIVAVPFRREEVDWLMVIGVPPVSEEREYPKNLFGSLFDHIADRIGDDVLRQDYFDTSIVELRAEGFDRFLEGLTASL